VSNSATHTQSQTAHNVSGRINLGMLTPLSFEPSSVNYVRLIRWIRRDKEGWDNIPFFIVFDCEVILSVKDKCQIRSSKKNHG
jgi:hypothetical protein